ncbi:MAG: ArsR family transcriptional regulator [Promethearchaeota archaeon]|nr:MAG: ArsR family transcriptional regulator [Candidatus Lokiarchaeota archaeon]
MFIIKVKRVNEIKAMLCCCEDITNTNEYFKELKELGENLRNNNQLNSLLVFLNALSNKERLIIFSSLKEKDRCVCELEIILNKSQPSISHHLRILEGAGLIRGWKKGKFTYYGIEHKNFKISQTDFIENLTLEKIA